MIRKCCVIFGRFFSFLVVHNKGTSYNAGVLGSLSILCYFSLSNLNEMTNDLEEILRRCVHGK